ncbi:PAS domain S-box protein [Nostoc sp. TCL26-01]|uniref:PAS domain S-box protein n=1 Tax=Nostoc sp. TCL26-01 TaxID=2576904 RepID=UPI0015BF38E8|nr:PAS domain S-box protein [Nostoc sp. TCL26-01]QLE57373.1 PAS domain S-box protein [Nostoc sp. TCL26-01]
MNSRIYQRFLPYGVAIGSVAIAFLLTFVLESMLSRTIASCFFVAVAATTWYGGMKPAIVTTILSALVIQYFFITPVNHLNPVSWSDAIRLVLFFCNASIINLLGSDLRTSKRKIFQLSQQLLEESAEQLRLAISATQMGLWNWNIQTGEIKWSPEHELVFGLAPGTFDGRYETFDARLHPQDREGLNQAVNRAIKKRSVYQHEYRIIWQDGSLHWVEGRGQAFYDTTGQPLRMMGTVIDISDRKQAEAALAKSEQYLRTIIDAEPECVKVITADGILLNMNAAGLAMIEANSLDQVLGQCVCPIVAPNHQQAFMDFTQQVAEGNPGVLEFEIIGLKGTHRWLESHAVVLPDADESENKVLAVTRDITARRQAEIDLRNAKAELETRVAARTAELSQANMQLQKELSDRKQVEEALQQSEAKFRSLSECSPIGIFMSDAQGLTTYTNPRAQEIGGYTFAEALGDGWLEFIHLEDRERILTEWSTVTSQNQRFSFEDVRYVHKDGTIRYARIESAPILSADGQQITHVGTIEDITASRAIAQMKNEFISIVSHELRTPLTAIRGSLGLLAAGVYDKKPEKGKRMLEIAADQTDRLVRLVNDILDLGRLESGKTKFEMQNCDAAKLIQQSVDTMRSSAEANQIKLSVNCPSLRVWADPDSIIQTLTNLLSNAIKFSPHDTTIYLSAEQIDTQIPQIPISVQTLTPCILFQVKDEGRGIPPENIETIFERFQQVDASDSRQKGGTGLGLAICRQIIQQHGGHIWAESVVDQGSIFYFTLPIVN